MRIQTQIGISKLYFDCLFVSSRQKLRLIMDNYSGESIWPFEILNIQNISSTSAIVQLWNSTMSLEKWVIIVYDKIPRFVRKKS